MVLNISYMLGIASLQASARIINSHKKWIKFIYFSPQIQTITNLFKRTNLCITFHATKTIYNFFKMEISTNTNLYDTSGIYGLTSATCHLNYLDQIGQSLKQRYSEHLWYIQCSVWKSYSTTRMWIWTHAKYNEINTPNLLGMPYGCFWTIFCS